MAIRDIYETGFNEDVQTESSANRCPECDGHVTTNVKETVCEDCGLVIEDQHLDHGPEWRAYDEDERERTGAPLTAARHDRGLSTEIGRGTDANGNELSAQKRRRLARMRREQTRGRWQSKAEQNLAHGLGEVRRLASALDLSDTLRDQACQLFRSAQNEDLLRGRSIEAIGVVSIYGTCRFDLLPPLKGWDSLKGIFRLRVSSAVRYAFASRVSGRRPVTTPDVLSSAYSRVKAAFLPGHAGRLRSSRWSVQSTRPHGSPQPNC